MDQDAQIETLRAEHQNLETQINEELKRPAPDEFRIQELKRQKLRLKDEIAQLATAEQA
jgi:hypothetical protein